MVVYIYIFLYFFDFSFFKLFFVFIRKLWLVSNIGGGLMKLCLFCKYLKIFISFKNLDVNVEIIFG